MFSRQADFHQHRVDVTNGRFLAALKAYVAADDRLTPNTGSRGIEDRRSIATAARFGGDSSVKLTTSSATGGEPPDSAAAECRGVERVARFDSASNRCYPRLITSGGGVLGQTSPERLRRPRTIGRLARRVLCSVDLLVIAASFAPVWTGLGHVSFYDCFKGPCGPPPFKTRLGPDGRPRIITKTTFWHSDAFHDLVAWLDLLAYID